jgi:hypothetical protein
MGLLPILLSVHAVASDGVMLRQGCDLDSQTVAPLNRGDRAEIRFALNGEDGTCYKVSVLSRGHRFEGYVPVRALVRSEEFDRQRRAAAAVDSPDSSSTPTPGAPPAQIQFTLADDRLAALGSEVSKRIARGEGADALQLVEERLESQGSNPSLLKLASVAAYYADRPTLALEFWQRVPTGQRDPALAALMERAQREVQSDRSNQRLTGVRFELRYDEQAISVEQARALLAVLDREFTVVAEQLGCEARGRLAAVVQSRDDYLRSTGAAEWSAGQFDGRIRVALMEASPGPATRQALVHEAVHACLVRLGKVPAWLHEGLAQKLSGERLSADDRQLVQQLARAGQLPPLSRIGASFAWMGDDRARAAYASALAAVELLYQHYGPAGVRSMLQNPDMLAHLSQDLDRRLRE